MVPNMTNTKKPNGIEMSSVDSMNGYPAAGAKPVMYMWCTHTTALMPTTPAKPATANLYENSGLRKNTTINSKMPAVAGTTMTYTSG
ncbi:unannotated protein [freshwater metagenome]|uniref:Unannotated protein n=1 Tax=freshwater metagenome TaxID=449393 RepID=A0A6J7GTZ9_9ZZZZ